MLPVDNVIFLAKCLLADVGKWDDFSIFAKSKGQIRFVYTVYDSLTDLFKLLHDVKHLSGVFTLQVHLDLTTILPNKSMTSHWDFSNSLTDINWLT